MWFKSLKLYRLAAGWALTPDALEDALAPREFKPGNALEVQTLGWIPPRAGGGLVHTVNRQMLLTLRAEKKLLPASVINQTTKARAQDIEEAQGYKPGRKQLKEIKERVTDELLPKAFSVYRDTRVWVDPVNRWLAIDTSASAKADEVLGFLGKSLNPFPVESLFVALSPAAAMTNWLAADEAPANFSIDQDTELRASGESRAAIRYVKHSVDAADARRHIQSGKQCTRLAMTWADRVSFVLTEALDIKRIAPLDVLKEGAEQAAATEDEQFDSDFVLMAGELAKLLDDMLLALGGEKAGEAHAPAVSSAPAAETIAEQDPLYEDAVRTVRANGRASISLVQRHLQIGYNRAARLIESMEAARIVSPMDSAGSRRLLST
jgi:recombination associated protein RdgC